MTTAPTQTGLGFASALSTDGDTDLAIAEVCRRAGEALGGTPDLALVFISHRHGPDFASVARKIVEATGTRNLVGCTGESIVGTGREVEEAPAISLWLARLPGVTVLPMHLEFERTPEGGSFVGFPDELPDEWAPGSAVLLLGEPFSFPADVLLVRWADDHAGVPVLGGMASGAFEAGANWVMLGSEAYNSGAVAVYLQGPVEIRSVVSQGCRPIGKPMVITKADKNVIMELAGQPALARLQELFATLSPEEQQMAQQGLHVGRVINEYQETFSRGDFLVRNVLGADRNSGAIAVGDYVRPGQTMQFHVRDAQTADEDLHELLTMARASDTAAPLGALLFTCNGRGTRLFPEPDHDAGVLRDTLGQIPAAGFFAQGEIGPVGGKNFVHGFTASVALFSPSRAG